MIELLDFKLRGGRDAPIAAARVATVTGRYLTRSGTHDLTAVVTEMVAWLCRGDPIPHTLRLELSVTSTVVRVSVTAARRIRTDEAALTNQVLRETLPVTAALAARYGVEANRRTRAWAEFDRRDSEIASYTGSRYS